MIVRLGRPAHIIRHSLFFLTFLFVLNSILISAVSEEFDVSPVLDGPLWCSAMFVASFSAASSYLERYPRQAPTFRRFAGIWQSGMLLTFHLVGYILAMLVRLPAADDAAIGAARDQPINGVLAVPLTLLLTHAGVYTAVKLWLRSRGSVSCRDASEMNRP